MHQVSKPRAANQSITDESGRPGTVRSKVGCEAMDEPCTKRIVPFGVCPVGGAFCHRNSFTSPLRVQCSVPLMRVLDSMTLRFGEVTPSTVPTFYARIPRA